MAFPLKLSLTTLPQSPTPTGGPISLVFWAMRIRGCVEQCMQAAGPGAAGAGWKEARGSAGVVIGERIWCIIHGSVDGWSECGVGVRASCQHFQQILREQGRWACARTQRQP